MKASRLERGAFAGVVNRHLTRPNTTNQIKTSGQRLMSMDTMHSEFEEGRPVVEDAR